MAFTCMPVMCHIYAIYFKVYQIVSRYTFEKKPVLVFHVSYYFFFLILFEMFASSSEHSFILIFYYNMYHIVLYQWIVQLLYTILSVEKNDDR